MLGETVDSYDRIVKSISGSPSFKSADHKAAAFARALDVYDTIMEKVACPFRHNDSPGRKQFQVITVLRRVGLRLLIIDEIHHVLAGSLLQQHNFLNTIKHLSNELQMPIVGVGTREAFNAIQTDPQLANRFEPVFLPRWSIGDRLKPEIDPYLQLLASFECLLPLNRPSNLTRPALALKILSLSEGLIGEVSAILTKAAVKAKVARRHENRQGPPRSGLMMPASAMTPTPYRLIRPPPTRLLPMPPAVRCRLIPTRP